MPLLKADNQIEELRKQSIEDIERDTAITWGERALAAYQIAGEKNDGEHRQRWLMDGENYRQESIEHAAMTADFDFVEALVGELDKARKSATKTAATATA